jgi:hypothetical protein
MKKIYINFPFLILLSFTAIGCQQKGTQTMPDNKLEIATLGGGCFWCVEAVYERVEGVKDVISGYAGGHTKNPTYKDVTSGETGHTEVTSL